jgi:hypothetical protein
MGTLHRMARAKCPDRAAALVELCGACESCAMDPTVDDELERQIRHAWASLIEKNPQWYADGGGLRADVRASTREHIRRGIHTMAGDVDPDRKAPEVWRETGRRRARQGVPLELVLNAYTLGTRVLWEALLEQGRNQDLGVDDRVLLMAGQRIWNALDVQNAVVVDAYRRESARLERRDLQRQQSYLDGLVGGRGSDPDFAREAAEILGVAVDDSVACVAAPFDELLDEPLRAPDDRLERAGRVSHWHVRGGIYFGLVALGGTDVADLVAALEPIAAGRVGVATSAEGIAGFAAAYALATRAAHTVPRGETHVVAVHDRLPEVLLGGSPDVASLLVEESIGPLLAHPAQQAEVLLETLRALLQHNGSPTHAAVALFCHRNTVIYRLKQIEQLTGRSLQVPRDRLLLVLGLIAAGRSGREPAAAGA